MGQSFKNKYISIKIIISEIVYNLRVERIFLIITFIPLKETKEKMGKIDNIEHKKDICTGSKTLRKIHKSKSKIWRTEKYIFILYKDLIFLMNEESLQKRRKRNNVTQKCSKKSPITKERKRNAKFYYIPASLK